MCVGGGEGGGNHSDFLKPETDFGSKRYVHAFIKIIQMRWYSKGRSLYEVLLTVLSYFMLFVRDSDH